MTQDDVDTKRELRDELELLCRCGRVTLDDDEAAAVSKLVSTELDWSLVLQEADFHRVLPLLHHHLKRLGRGTCPDEIWRKLHAESVRTAANNAQLAAALKHLTARFRQESIPFLSVKGPVVAAELYGDIVLRPSVDLDVLVRHEDLSAVFELLQHEGFTPLVEMGPRLRNRYVNRYSELLFLRRKPYAAIDVHWSLLSEGFSFNPANVDIWRRAVQTRLDGESLTVLSQEDMLLFFCVHSAKHSWELLQWLVDISELLGRGDDLDWEYVRSSALRGNATRMVAISLQLCRVLLDLDLPAGASRIACDAKSARIVAGVIERMFREQRDGERRVPIPWRMPYFHAMESQLDRCRLTYNTIFRPTAVEWTMFPLPGYLSPLYFLIRPVRLCARHAARLVRAK